MKKDNKYKTSSKAIQPKETVATILNVKITTEEFNKPIKIIPSVK